MITAVTAVLALLIALGGLFWNGGGSSAKTQQELSDFKSEVKTEMSQKADAGTVNAEYQGLKAMVASSGVTQERILEMLIAANQGHK